MALRLTILFVTTQSLSLGSCSFQNNDKRGASFLSTLNAEEGLWFAGPSEGTNGLGGCLCGGHLWSVAELVALRVGVI